MKIKFDENISPRVVAAIRCLETDKDIEISSVHEDYGTGLSDPAWMFRFRDEGGLAMISGDHNILQTPSNLIAYMESRLVSIWPPGGWPQLKKWGQTALIINWWPAIKLRIKSSSEIQAWRLPLQWTPGVEQFRPIVDPRRATTPPPRRPAS